MGGGTCFLTTKFKLKAKQQTCVYNLYRHQLIEPLVHYGGVSGAPTLCIEPRYITVAHGSGGFRGERNRRSPLNFDRLYFLIPFYIRMRKNKAQIAPKTKRASRALKRALDPCREGLQASRS